MTTNLKPSASPSGNATPPLRSTTIQRPPPANRTAPGGSAAAAGFDSIRLNTYHDSSDLKAALRELEAAFAGSDNTAASSSIPATSAAAPSSSSSRTRPAPKNAASTSTTAPKVMVAAQSKISTSPPPPPSRKQPSRPSFLLQLPPQLLLRCFTFCDLKTLGLLCSVSVRLNVMVTQQGSTLWAAAALRRRIPVPHAAAARDELRRALEQRAHARHAEEEFYATEIARMEERLRARAEDVYAQNVDVDRTITTGGDSRGGEATALPYWVRPQKTTETAPASEKSSTAAQLCAKMRAEVEALEEVRRLCECRLALQEDSLRQQETQLRQWQALLSPGDVTASAATALPNTTPGETTAPKPLITAAQLAQFERRVARLVLNGGLATGAVGVEDDVGTGIPFVFRYGVEDFATLALILRAISVPANVDNAASSDEASQNSGAPSRANVTNCESGNGDGGRFVAEATRTTASTTAAARNAVKRWRAFQQVCPVNEEYGNVRCYLAAQELRTDVTSAANDESSSGDRGGRPSAKQVPALLRLSSFVRRVAAMTDDQVVQAWM